MKPELIKHFFMTSVFLASFCITKGQEANVPIDVQLELLPKILSLNKSYDLEDPNQEINVGILYNSSLRSSTKAKDEILDQVPGNEIQIKKAKIYIIPVDLSQTINIKDLLAKKKVQALYITPLRGHNISEIAEICKELQIISFTGVANFIEDNDISVGFELENNKLQITINLESAKAEGANFSSRLLSVSQIK